jgi:hypothetical protein
VQKRLALHIVQMFLDVYSSFWNDPQELIDERLSSDHTARVPHRCADAAPADCSVWPTDRLADGCSV